MGEKMVYVNDIIRDKSGKVVAYNTDIGRLPKRKAIQLTKQGKLDNVIVVRQRNGNEYLRTKGNAQSDDNLTG